MRRALESVDVAYYLIHSLGAGASFEQRDRDAAGIFADAAMSAGLKRIVYLGGIVSGRASGLSPHLRSRGEVGDILLGSGVPTAALQAAIIIGSGSASFEMRRRARCEDRIRNAKDTGLRNLPLYGFAQNQIWCELVAMASELLAWTAMLALHSPARAWEPKRLRLRLFSAAGRLVRGGRRLRLRLAATWPWAGHLTAAITHLHAYAPG